MALITKTELLNNGFNIDKKYILIDSSIYEKEAYEYILKLVDKEGAIAFVKDLKQIYAQGQFYGSDIWSTDLSFFSKFNVFSNSGELNGFIEAINGNSELNIKGKNGVVLYVEESDSKCLTIDYDLHSRVNTSKFTFDNSSMYNLEVIDGQITMVKYTPASVYVKSLSPIEYDTTDENSEFYTISFTIEVYGTEKLVEFSLRSSLDTDTINLNYVISYNKEKQQYNVTVPIPVNTDVTFTINYSDGYDKGTGTYKFKQQWGYACVYSNVEITKDNFTELNKYIAVNSVSNKISINQNNDEKGWYACPSKFNPTFTDTSVNIQGGWSKLSGLEIYNDNIPYTIYITDNSGLGLTTWQIA